MLGATGSEGSHGQVFPFSPSPPAKHDVEAETSAAVGSVFCPEDKHGLLPAVPPLSQQQPWEEGWPWLSQPTGLPDRAVPPKASCFCCVHLLYFETLMAGTLIQFQ